MIVIKVRESITSKDNPYGPHFFKLLVKLPFTDVLENNPSIRRINPSLFFKATIANPKLDFLVAANRVNGETIPMGFLVHNGIKPGKIDWLVFKKDTEEAAILLLTSMIGRDDWNILKISVQDSNLQLAVLLAKIGFWCEKKEEDVLYFRYYKKGERDKKIMSKEFAKKRFEICCR